MYVEILVKDQRLCDLDLPDFAHLWLNTGILMIDSNTCEVEPASADLTTDCLTNIGAALAHWTRRIVHLLHHHSASGH